MNVLLLVRVPRDSFRILLGFPEDHGEAVGVPGDGGAANLIAQFIVRLVVEPTVINEYESSLLDFLDQLHRIHAPAILRIVRFHVPASVILDAVKTAGFEGVVDVLVQYRPRRPR